MEQHGAESNLNLDWNLIDTVLLDLDGTLLDLNFDLEFWLEYIPEIYSKKHNIKIDEAKELIISMINSQEGKLTWYCLDYCCLLYTSPSPRDNSGSRMPSSA